MATQNPIESEGTYPLPEAQIDRFMLKIVIGYPEHDEELTIVQRQLVPPPELREALTLETCGPAAGRLRRSTSTRRSSATRSALATATREPAAHGLAELAQLHRVRRQPARPDQPRPGGPRAGARSAGATTSRRGPARAGEGRAAAPARAHLPGARRGGEPGRRSSTRVIGSRAACRSIDLATPSAT